MQQPFLYMSWAVADGGVEVKLAFHQSHDTNATDGIRATMCSAAACQTYLCCQGVYVTDACLLPSSNMHELLLLV